MPATVFRSVLLPLVASHFLSDHISVLLQDTLEGGDVERFVAVGNAGGEVRVQESLGHGRGDHGGRPSLVVSAYPASNGRRSPVPSAPDPRHHHERVTTER